MSKRSKKQNLKERRVKHLMERFSIGRQDAEFIDPHPHAGHVIGYAQFRGISLRAARESGGLWCIVDPTAEQDGANQAYAWANTAHEAWRQCRNSISTHPPFGRCTFERLT